MRSITFILSSLLIFSAACSSDDDVGDVSLDQDNPETEVTEESDTNISEQDTASVTISTTSINLEAELDNTQQTLDPLNSLEDVQNNGWSTIYIDPETGSDYRGRIGYLYLNESWIDETFVASEPEGILLAVNPAGKFRIMGAAFIVEGEPDTPPEGYFGDDDVWQYMSEEGVWVLHVWLKGVNPRGLFSFYHPGVANNP